MSNKNNKALSNEDVIAIHTMLVEDFDQTVSSVAKELGITPAGLYYRFDALGLEAPEAIRLKVRNNEIKQKSDEGMSASELRNTYKLSKPSIYAIIRKVRNEETRKQLTE